MTKRVFLPALMISAALLTACGGGDAEERIEARREFLAAAETIRFTAKASADLGDEVFLCTLSCEADGEGVTVEVLAPELVAGVRARAAAGETALLYDGVILSLGDGAGGPMGAMPELVEALKSGHVVRAWTEGERLGAELYAGEDRSLTLWYDGETLDPVEASFGTEGREYLRCEILEFTYQ